MEWLKGKKTFIAAGLIALAGVVGFFQGQVNDAQLIAVLGFALGLAGMSDKLGRFLPVIVAALDEIKKQQAVSIKVNKIEGIPIAPSIELGPSATTSSASTEPNGK